MTPIDPLTADTLRSMVTYISDDGRIARYLRIPLATVARYRRVMNDRRDRSIVVVPQEVTTTTDYRTTSRPAAKMGSDRLLAALRRAGG